MQLNVPERTDKSLAIGGVIWFFVRFWGQCVAMKIARAMTPCQARPSARERVARLAMGGLAAQRWLV